MLTMSDQRLNLHLQPKKMSQERYSNFKLIKFCDDDNVNTTAQLFNVSYVVMLPLQLLFICVLVRNMDKKIQWRMR